MNGKDVKIFFNGIELGPFVDAQSIEFGRQEFPTADPYLYYKPLTDPVIVTLKTYDKRLSRKKKKALKKTWDRLYSLFEDQQKLNPKSE